jgi:phospholipid/cholesterol/gamma-HCH transport system permease protein
MGMSARPDNVPARAIATLEGDRLDVALVGSWQITDRRLRWSEVLGDRHPEQVRVREGELEQWDSSVLLFLFEAQEACRVAGATCDLTALPERMRHLLEQLAKAHGASHPADRTESFLTTVGLASLDTVRKGDEISRFVGECTLSMIDVLRRPRHFRWRDCLHEMQQCGAMALPIVSLISFLVGVTLAYTAAIVLRQFGGDIWIADLIGLSMVREMGAVMTAVVLAGRTGAAYAATLGNMKANEEIDALETLGISSVQFLVLPRMVALAIMMPLLSLYSNALGILGGMVVAMGLLAIPPTAYWVEMQTIVDMSDIMVGVIKGGAFGVIVGLAGCLRGLQAERSAVGVGRAATSAVVTAILLLIIADAIFAVLFNVLNW